MKKRKVKVQGKRGSIFKFKNCALAIILMNRKIFKQTSFIHRLQEQMNFEKGGGQGVSSKDFINKAISAKDNLTPSKFLLGLRAYESRENFSQFMELSFKMASISEKVLG